MKEKLLHNLFLIMNKKNQKLVIECSEIVKELINNDKELGQIITDLQAEPFSLFTAKGLHEIVLRLKKLI